jgi:acyl carrier protein
LFIKSNLNAYSLGEFAGLVIAGVLNLKDALIFIATRERLVLEKCKIESSGMVAVSLEPVKLQILLESQQEFFHLSIACYNSPTDCVVSGPLPQLAMFKKNLDMKSIRNSQLPVSFGYHGLAMAPVIDDLRFLSRKIKIEAPSLPVISTVVGRVVLPGDISSFDNDYFVRHCAEPVRFTQGIYSYVSNADLFFGRTIWIELGPHPRILPMLQKFPDLSDSMFLGSLRKGQDSWSAISATLCSLYLTDQSLDWRRVFGQLGSTSCISLPSYPFSKKRFWVPFREETAPSMVGTQAKDSMVHDWVQLPGTDNGNIAIFEIPMTRIERYMKGHCVAGVPLCPASVYLEFVIAGVILTTKHLAKYYDDLHVALQQIHFTKVLTSAPINEGNIMIKLVIETESGTFSIGSGLPQSESQTVHAHGEYRLQSASDLAAKLARNITSIPQVLKPEKAHCSEFFSARTVYEVIFPRVVKYSKEFQTVQFLVINSDGMGASATIALGSVCDRPSFVIDPVFLDTLLHVVGFISNLRGDLHEAYICDEIGLVEFIPSFIKSGSKFVIHCNISWISENNAMLGESYAVSDAHPGIVVAHMKGIRFRRVRLGSLKAGLANSLEMASSSLVSTSPELSQSNEQKVFQIIARSCDINAGDISLASDLDLLGIDSLMRLELGVELAKAFPTIGDIKRNILKCNNTLDIVNMISSGSTIFPDNVRVIEESFYTSPSATSSSSTLVLDVDGKSPLRRLLADVLEIEQSVITDNQDLTYLGLDSLASMEAIYRIKKEYNLHLSASFFEVNRTIHDIHASIQDTLKSSPINDKLNTQLVVNNCSPVEGKLADILNLDRKLVPLQQSSGNETPLVLIHDGSGLTISYRCITDLNRDVWGINNPRFASSTGPLESVLEMAESYAEYILDKLKGTSSSLILGG